MNNPIVETCLKCKRRVWKAGERLCIKHDILAVLSTAPRKYVPLTPKSAPAMPSKQPSTGAPIQPLKQ